MCTQMNCIITFIKTHLSRNLNNIAQPPYQHFQHFVDSYYQNVMTLESSCEKAGILTE